VDPAEAELVVEKLLSLESSLDNTNLQACIEHMEDGLALTTDALNGLGLD
jgi:hypothetical protein